MVPEEAAGAATIDTKGREAVLGVPAEAVGVERLTVTQGKEVFELVQYNSFSVGPMVAEVVPRPDESIVVAIARTQVLLQAAFEEEYERKLRGYLDRLGRAAAAFEAAKKKGR
jgi:hypothetical protein